MALSKKIFYQGINSEDRKVHFYSFIITKIVVLNI